MKMNRIIWMRSAVVIAMISGVMACSDYLDQTVNGQLPEDQYYKTDEDAQFATIGIYDQVSNMYNGTWASMYLLKQIISDESNAGGGDSQDQLGYQQMDKFTHDSKNDQVLGVWSATYAGIARANRVINITAQENDLRVRLVAEAKFLRAYMYMDLVSMWGEVPLVVDNIPASEFQSTPRASKAEIYAQIEQDLNDAIAILPVKSDYPVADRFRASKGAAQALLGKALVYQEKWSAAVDAFEDVIGSGEYQLEESVSAVFDRTGEFGPESLFEISMVNSLQQDWGNFPWGNSYENNIVLQLMGPRGDAPGLYVPATGDTLIAGWGFNLPTQKIYDAYVDAGDNTRRRESVMSEAELVAAGGSFGTGWEYENVIRRKYGSFNNQTGGPVGELNYGTNWRVLRYADVLLLAAEANFRNSNETKAKEYLNDVRSRPGTNLPDVTATGPALFDAIVLERNLELSFEGHRFVDLVRWGLADEELGPLGFKPNKNEVLPIPETDVLAAKLTQNQGY